MTSLQLRVDIHHQWEAGPAWGQLDNQFKDLLCVLHEGQYAQVLLTFPGEVGEV
jgi:hypothetical protein